MQITSLSIVNLVRNEFNATNAVGTDSEYQDF